MRRVNKIFSALLVASFFMVSCQDDDYKLGELLPKDQIKYEVIQLRDIDATGNTVVLINRTPGTIALWDYGTGRSTRAQDTVRYPFKGEYTIKFSAVTGGGIVEADSMTISVTENNLNYVSDPLWTYISGGPGNEKEWVLDTEGKFFPGPLSFFGTNNGWLKGGDVVWLGAKNTGCYGADCWNWDPDAAWTFTGAMAPGDYGVMTFSLSTGANFSATKPMEGGIQEQGTYFLNTNDKKLTINNASILRGYKPAKNGLTGISNWTDYTIFALDENTLRLGVIRDRDVDGEGKAFLVYNFISKKFSEE